MNNDLLRQYDLLTKGQRPLFKKINKISSWRDSELYGILWSDSLMDLVEDYVIGGRGLHYLDKKDNLKIPLLFKKERE